MSYDLTFCGTTRITNQAYLTPTGTPLRIYEVFVVSSGSNQRITFGDVVPGTTATNTTLDKLYVATTDSTTSYFLGQYSNVMGVRFDNGALFHTCSAFHFAIVNYVTEK